MLGLALLVRVLVGAALTNFDPATANIWEYGDIARYSLDKGRLVYAQVLPGGELFFYRTAFMPPFLIFVWMGLFKVFGVTKLALMVMTALNILMGVGIVYYTVRIARALFGSETVAFIAGLFMALNPVFVYSVTTYHALNLYILLLLIVFDLTLSTRKQTIWVSLAAGILTGIAALVRTEYLILAGAINLGALITHRQWKMTLVAAFATLLVIAPWTARNYVVFGRLIPVANSEGYNFFKGFNPYANGSGNWVDENHIGDKLLSEKLAQVPHDQNYENGIDKVYRDAAFQYMRVHPLRSFLVLPLIKVGLFWFYDFTDSLTHQLLYQLQFWPLFLLSLMGLGMAARGGYFSRPDHRTVLILFAFQTLVMMGYAVHARYRMNVEPFLYAYAAFGLFASLVFLVRRKAS
jgi:hypothetical protein